MAPGRSKALTLLGYKAAYFFGWGLLLVILYTTQESLLIVRDRATDTTAKSATTEAFLWATLAFAWASYLVFHGSDPGYVPLPAAHDDEEEGEDAEAAAELREAQRAAPFDPSALVRSIATVRARNSPSANGASAGAGTGGGWQPSSSSDAQQQQQPHHTERSRMVDAALEDADPDYEPISVDAAPASAVGVTGGAGATAAGGGGTTTGGSAAPDAAAAAAIAAAQRAERECRQCHARQPARAHHCRVCDRCVATFDHHCGMVGTCVGERNRCRFWWMLAGQVAALAAAIGVLTSGLAYRRYTGDWVAANAVSLAALAAAWVLEALLGGLLVFHCWLAATNTTTFETLVGSARLWYLAGTQPRDCDLPYSGGLCGNLRLFCCVLEGGGSGGGWWCCRRRRRSGGDAADDDGWVPHAWACPGPVDRNSGDVRANLWENRYWSCC